MAKIAVAPNSESSRPTARVLAKGEGWSVRDVICTLGPQDRPFEERHSGASIAVVVAGTFQYRSKSGRDLMTPGSLLLGNEGQVFECGHDHGTGDRCLSISYAPYFIDRLASDTGAASPGFRMQRLPPLRALSTWTARSEAFLAAPSERPWEEFVIELAAQTINVDRGLSSAPVAAEPSAASRVSPIVRLIEARPDAPHDLASLAVEARLSPYHFLRTFQALTGVTPHQYLLRVRLRRAAVRLSTESARILDIALDSGFGDVSNFNRTFRAEFGVSPRVYRAQTSRV